MAQKIIKILIIFFFISSYGYSESDSTKIKRPFSISLNLNRGLIINHKKGKLVGGEINNSLVLTYFTALQAMAEWQTTGNKQWHKWFNYPSYGFSVTYFNIAESRIGHHGLALMSHLSIKCITHPVYRLKFGVGVGVGYFLEIYNQNTNPINQYVSTNFNASIQFLFENSFKISNNTLFLFTPTINHFSNGAMMLPNFGLNMLGLSVGVKYIFLPSDSQISPTKPDIFKDKKNFLHFGISYGSNGLAVPYYNQFYNYTLDLSVGRKIGSKSKLLIGINIMHCNMDNNISADKLVKVYRPFLEIDRIGFWLGHEFIVNRLGIITGLGMYAKSTSSKNDGVFFARIGLRYHFHKNIFCAVYLRTKQNASADNIEWTLGFTL